LEQPQFGHWVGVARNLLGALHKKGVVLPFPDLYLFKDAGLAAIEKDAVKLRNHLAHGPGRRYQDVADYIDRVSSLLLDIVAQMQRLMSVELLCDGGRVFFPVDGGPAPRRVPLYPFVIPDGGSEKVLLFEGLEKRVAKFSSGEEIVRNGDLCGLIRDYLSSTARPFAVQSPAALSTREILERSLAAVHSFWRRLHSDPLYKDLFFAELPPLAGRPDLGRHLVETLRTADRPLVYVLYGRSGAGKRRLLADVLCELGGREHVVAPVFAVDTAGEPLARAWNRALQLDGDVADLAAAVAAKAPQSRLILAVDDVSRLVKDPQTAAQLEDLVRRRGSWSNVALLLAGAQGPDCMTLSMPPMEPQACAEFFDAVTAHPQHAPLSDWYVLPEAAREAAALPADLVRLCAHYDGRSVPDDFSVFTEYEDVWKRDVSENPDVGVRRARIEVLTETAAVMLKTGQAELPVEGCDVLDSPHERLRHAREDLQTLGILTPTLVAHGSEFQPAMTFTDYHWLTRSLLLVLDLDGVAGTVERSWQHVFARARQFGAVCDAVALWAQQRPPDQFVELFGHVLKDAGEVQGRLVETLLVRAVPDRDLFFRLVDMAAEGGEPALYGCAAAARQIVETGSEAARQIAADVYGRILAVATKRSIPRLEAVLWNEFALFIADPHDLDQQRNGYASALALALEASLPEVVRTAANNLASLEVEEAERWQADPRLACRLAERARGLVESGATAAPDASNWWEICRSLQLCARACQLLPDPLPDQARRCQDKAVRLAERFGSAADLGAAWEQLACLVVEQGDFPTAMQHFSRAIGSLRIAGDRVAEARCWSRAGWGKLHWFQAAEDERWREMLLSALEDIRQARRILHHCHQGPEVGRLLGETSANMAAVMKSLGELAAARNYARDGLAHFEQSESIAEAEMLREFIRQVTAVSSSYDLDHGRRS
jgi:tetratricopeptide (TPR) repeat protein